MARMTRTSIFRSERYAAISLALAAVLGLLLANSVAGPGLIELVNSHVGFPAIGLDLSIEHWVTDGLLAIFFFLIAIELRHELTHGELNSWQHALAPGVAALGGVVIPAALYLVIAGAEFGRGWPIPTATDIAFALGLIALIGRGLPTRIRAFLLALAVLDDLIAILIIALFFTTSIDFIALGMAVFAVYLFRFIGCRARLSAKAQIPLYILIGIAAWYFTLISGVHATIAGVALGLVMNPLHAKKAAHALQPLTNAVILPLFALISALVIIPSASLSDMSPVFWGITVGLPVGKLVGIFLAGSLIAWFIHRKLKASSENQASATLVVGWDLLTIAAVGGIGFTVSLLMNELAFAGMDAIADEGVLAVLTGSAVSIILGGILVAWRARVYRKREDRLE